MTTGSLIKCSEGGTHDWTYLGRAKKAYRCKKCGDLIGKAELQKETN